MIGDLRLTIEDQENRAGSIYIRIARIVPKVRDWRIENGK